MSFEESASDLTQNVASLGFDLEELKKQYKLRVDHVRIERSEIEETGEYDLEGLFIRLNYPIDSIGGKRVVLDTIESIFSGMENTVFHLAGFSFNFTEIKRPELCAKLIL